MSHDLDPLLGPVWLRAELVAGGCPDREIAQLLRAGVLRRLRRGAYTSGTAYDAADAAGRHALLARAVAMQAQTEVVLSHTSAVAFHGGPVWDVSTDLVHVTRTDGRAGRREAGVCQHHGVLLDGDVTQRAGLEVTSPTRTGIDVTTCVSSEGSLVVVNDLLHRRLTTLTQLRDRYATMARNPHTLRTEIVLRLADPRMESVGESRTYWMFYRFGLPAPTPQYEVTGARGAVLARLDFAWPDRGVWLEFDGRVKYTRHLKQGESVVDAVIREKERESRIAELTGWRCIRLTWPDLERPEVTAARVASLLGVAPRVPSLTR